LKEFAYFPLLKITKIKQKMHFKRHLRTKANTRRFSQDGGFQTAK